MLSKSSSIRRHDVVPPPHLLIDGLNLFYRHFAANPSMSSFGYPVGGALGFMKNLQSLVRDIGPKDVTVVWESGGSSRRRAIFPAYKSKKRPRKLNRFYDDDIPETVENLDDQFSFLLLALKKVPIKQLYVQDCEADDIMGYAVRNLISDDYSVIVSSDRDLMQLVGPKTVQWNPAKKSYVNRKTVLEEFGVLPCNLCTVRCFVGDPSDGIDGVPGIGFSTMVKRFPFLTGEEFVSVEDVIEECERTKHSTKVKIYGSILEQPEIPRRNWRLMHLDVSNLSGTQIQFANELWNQEPPKPNKISFLKVMMKYGINNFDADSFFNEFRSNIRRQDEF
jgi:DNA polymerase-1